VKDRVGLADNLFGLPALEALGALVPGEDLPFPVKLVDREIPGGVDQPVLARFACDPGSPVLETLTLPEDVPRDDDDRAADGQEREQRRKLAGDRRILRRRERVSRDNPAQERCRDRWPDS
jgi:hypothetical protein